MSRDVVDLAEIKLGSYVWIQGQRGKQEPVGKVVERIHKEMLGAGQVTSWGVRVTQRRPYSSNSDGIHYYYASDLMLLNPSELDEFLEPKA